MSKLTKGDMIQEQHMWSNNVEFVTFICSCTCAAYCCKAIVFLKGMRQWLPVWHSLLVSSILHSNNSLTLW